MPTSKPMMFISTESRLPPDTGFLKSLGWVDDVGVYKRVARAQIRTRQLAVSLVFFLSSGRAMSADYGSGFIGVSPSFMSRHQDIERMMVEGAFLTDDDTHGILVSYQLAKHINLTIGDMVWLGDRLRVVESFWIRGFFNDSTVGRMRFLDGLQFDRPFRIDGFDRRQIVVIGNLAVPISYTLTELEVFIHPGREEEALGFAREIVFKQDCDVYVISKNEMISYRLLKVVEDGGILTFPILLGSLIIINLLGQGMFEQKKEFGILGVLGANPSDIRRSVVLIGFVAATVSLLLSLSLIGIVPTLFSYGFLPFRINHLQGALASFSLSLSTIVASFVGILQVQKSIVTTTPSKTISHSFEGLFHGVDLEKTSTIPRRFGYEHLPYVASFVERVIQEHQIPSERRMGMRLYNTRLEWGSESIRYTAETWIQKEENSSAFRIALDLLTKDDKTHDCYVRLRLSPVNGCWGTHEKTYAKDIVKTLRKEIFALSLASHTSQA